MYCKGSVIEIQFLLECFNDVVGDLYWIDLMFDEVCWFYEQFVVCFVIDVCVNQLFDMFLID